MKKLLVRAKRKWQALRQKYSDSPHRSFKQTPRVKRNKRPILGVKEGWLLIAETTLFLKRHRKLFIWLIILYAVTSYFLVGGISQIDYAALKTQSSTYANGLDAITKAAAYFSAALTGGLTQAPTDVQRFLSGFTILLFWLSTTWLTRMLMAGKKVKLRDGFYNGPTPFISTIGVLFVVCLELIPAALGLFAFTIAVTQNWVVSAIEGLAFGGAAVLMCLLSLYWLTGSIIATAIVALPGMYPLQALADARTLVMGKRWDIVVRIISVLIIQLIAWSIILLPIFLLDGWLNLPWLPIVPVAVQIMGGFSIIFTSVYVYKLYRSLL